MTEASRSPIWRRLARQGITWPQFAFQLVIVTAGVYLGTVVQERADQRGRREASLRALVALRSEVTEDEANLREVIASQAKLTAGYRGLAAAVRNPAAPDSLIERLVVRETTPNPTFYSRRAAYSTLVSSGLLQYVADTDLQLTLANLYEQHYVRLERNGELIDDAFQNVFKRGLLDYWDYSRRRPISRTEAAAVRASNAAQRMVTFSEYYQNLLDNELKLVTGVRHRLEVYLRRQGASGLGRSTEAGVGT